MEEKNTSLWQRFKERIQSAWESIKDWFRGGSEHRSYLIDRIAGGTGLVQMRFQKEAAEDEKIQQEIEGLKNEGTDLINKINEVEKSIWTASEVLNDPNAGSAAKAKAFSDMNKAKGDLIDCKDGFEVIEYRYKEIADQNEINKYINRINGDMQNTDSIMARYQNSVLMHQENGTTVEDIRKAAADSLENAERRGRLADELKEIKEGTQRISSEMNDVKAAPVMPGTDKNAELSELREELNGYEKQLAGVEKTYGDIITASDLKEIEIIKGNFSSDELPSFPEAGSSFRENVTNMAETPHKQDKDIEDPSAGIDAYTM